MTLPLGGPRNVRMHHILELAVDSAELIAGLRPPGRHRIVTLPSSTDSPTPRASRRHENLRVYGERGE